MGVFDIYAAGSTLAEGSGPVVGGTAIASGSLAILGCALDPVNAILGAPVEFLLEWLIANVKPFKEATDALLGDPGGVHQNGQRWSDIGTDTQQIGTNQLPTSQLVSSWKGQASTEYQKIHAAVGETISQAKGTYDNFAQLSELVAGVIGAVRGVVWGLIRDAITEAIVDLVVGLINSFWSFGASVVAALAKAGFKIAATIARITDKISKLLKTMAEASKVGSKLATILSKASEQMAKFTSTLLAHSNLQNGAATGALSPAVNTVNGAGGAEGAYK